jgi:uroporphyrinogen-III synthase
LRSAILYAAEAATALSPAVRERLAAGEIDAVLFFSPRTARTFVNLIRNANMTQACRAIDAVCLSPAVAEAASGVAWRAVHVAASPDQAAMMEERNRMQTGKDSDPSARPGNDRAGNDKAAGDRSRIPSTLEKAVARDAKDRKADAATEAAPTDGKKPVEKSPSHRGTLGLVGVLVLLLVLAGGWIAWPAWGPTLPGWLHGSIAPLMEAGRSAGGAGRVDEIASRIAGLERDIAAVKADIAARPRVDPARLSAIGDTARGNADRIGAMEADLAALRKSVAERGPSEAAASLARRLGEAESRIAALAAEPGTKAAVEALDTLRTQSSARMTVLERENDALRKLIAMHDERLAALEKRPAAVAGAGRANALVIAVGQLREAARGAAPFADALEGVKAIAEDDAALQAEIAALAPLAATGVPDLTALRLRFDRISAGIASEAFVPKGEGWIDRTLQQLSRLVTVKRSGIDAASRDDENGRVVRAELRLAAGDLAGAVAALDGLSGRAAELAAPWLTEARSRLAVDRAVGRLFAEALRRTGAAAREATGG